MLKDLTPDDLAKLEYEWQFWARPQQLMPPGNWRVWLYLAGRGAGKSRSGAEAVRSKIEAGAAKRVALVAPTAADARDVMVEGESGVLAISPPWFRPLYEPSKRRLTWPNGAIATTYSADEPDRLRGPQHDFAWADEACLVAGTLIETAQGPVPIEQIKPGHFVHTRHGLHPVKYAWETSVAALVQRLRTSDGRTLTGTPNHPVFEATRGFVSLQSLRHGDMLHVWDRISSSGVASAGTPTTMIITKTGKESSFTGNCIWKLSALLIHALKCITATANGRISLSTISKLYQSRNIIASIRAALYCGTANNDHRSFVLFGTRKSYLQRFARGAAVCSSRLERVRSSARPIAGRRFGVPIQSSALRRTVLFVGKPFCFINRISATVLFSAHKQINKNLCSNAPFVEIHSAPQVRRPNVVPALAGMCFVLDVEILSQPAVVYNLEVEDEHEYFANGILTHNCAWRYPDTWDMLMFGLRLGGDPRAIVTTTPRPVRLIREFLADPTVAVTRGSTYDNAANLAPAFLAQIVRKYEGTRLGRQELLAELLDDVPGALWTRDLIERTRVARGMFPDLARVVVAIDPAVTSGEESDETGIIVAGADRSGHGWVLSDLSGRYPPTDWARQAIAAYREHRADRIVAEINNGGDMVEATLRMIDPNIPYTAVRATRGKVVRAEPVAALYEQGRIHHVGGFPELEDQMCSFTPDLDRKAAGWSPDRVDALVWAISELLVEPMPAFGSYEFMRRAAEATKKPPPEPKPTIYAVGSEEWRQQQAAGGGDATREAT